MPSSLHSPDYQLFRSMLIEARTNSGLTQTQIAETLVKPQSYVSKYERGERRIDFPEFMELANVLKIDVEVFVNNYKTALAATKVQKIRRTSKAS
jgi:transcriptional regulator with XRE-family HTH domain